MPERPRRPGPPRRTPRDARAFPTGPVPIDSGTAEVRADAHGVTVLVNGVPSSHLDLADPTRLDFEYMQHMSVLIDLLPPGPVRALHLGAGACTLPRWLDAVRPGSRQLAVDVDPVLLALVRDLFDLPRSPRLRLRSADARAALTGVPDASMDLVVRDVFAGDTTPAHLTTTGFLAQVARVLRPGGLYLANCADRPPLALARAEVATARAVLGDVALAAEPGQLKGRRYGNLVVAGTRPGTGGAGPALGGAEVARRLRALAVPVRLLHGGELSAFAAGAAPRHDPPGWHLPAEDAP